MKRTFYSIIAFLVLPGWVYALGLGKLELDSGLNQPFDARIEILSASADDISGLSVNLADYETFQRAGVERQYILNSLKFTVEENETGPDYIRITSTESIREPFLNFLLEAYWSRGRLIREYTVLLDPPLYDPYARKSAAVAPYIPEETAVVEEPETVVSEEPEVFAEEEVSTPVVSQFTGEEYGPTVTDDTLWSIATKMRPDSSVSVQQMMLALLQANPEAFAGNNINGLRRGQILRMPDTDMINALSGAEAIAEVKSQNSAWEDIRGTLASSVTDRAETTAVDATYSATAETSATPEAEDTAELRLVGAEETGTVTGEGDGSSGMGSDTSNALLNEQLSALSQENLELKDRLTEAETIIEDLKRLIALKDDELASFQGQLGAKETVATTEPAADAEAPVEEEVVTDDTGGPEEAVEEEADAEAGLTEESEAEVEVSLDLGTETEEEVTEPEVDTTTEVEAPPPPAGLVDQLMNFIMTNLVVAGGALLGLIILLGLSVVFIKRKRDAGETAGQAETEASAFPDFSGEAEATEAPAAEGEAGEDFFDLDAAAAAAPEAAAVEAAAPEAAEPEPEPEPEPVAEEPEEDPLAEVNVFLAYEHFDQAEEFVRDAISGNPDNLDFHAKLLEVFYAAGNKKSYEEAAQVLHDKVNGEGAHWDMALAMWQEMSPNRALFAEPVEGEDEAVAAEPAGGGIVDITSEDDAGEQDAGLDFDLGMGDEAAPEPEAPGGETEELLDITGGGEDVLDVTAAIGVDEASDEDLLDVTAAVGLSDDGELELPGETIEGEQDMLDITGGADAGQDDLLDVTAQTDLESSDLEEDLLDVTSATSAGADSDALLDLPGDTVEEPAAEAEDVGLDFDIGGIGIEEPAVETDTSDAETDDNVIDFDAASIGSEEDSLDLDIGGISDDENIEMDTGDIADETMKLDIDAGDGGIELDLSADLATDDAQSDELSLDDDGGIELDIGDLGDGALELDDSEAGSLELDDSAGDLGIELDLNADDSSADDAGSIDLDGTVEMSMSDLGLDIDMDDGDDDHTVFVPAAGDGSEQSKEDEVATQLDMARMYVEMGEADGAKGMLEEILKTGNDEQRQQAQDLLDQIS